MTKSKRQECSCVGIPRTSSLWGVFRAELRFGTVVDGPPRSPYARGLQVKTMAVTHVGASRSALPWDGVCAELCSRHDVPVIEVEDRAWGDALWGVNWMTAMVSIGTSLGSG